MLWISGGCLHWWKYRWHRNTATTHSHGMITLQTRALILKPANENQGFFCCFLSPPCAHCPTQASPPSLLQSSPWPHWTHWNVEAAPASAQLHRAQLAGQQDFCGGSYHGSAQRGRKNLKICPSGCCSQLTPCRQLRVAEGRQSYRMRENQQVCY